MLKDVPNIEMFVYEHRDRAMPRDEIVSEIKKGCDGLLCLLTDKVDDDLVRVNPPFFHARHIIPSGIAPMPSTVDPQTLNPQPSTKMHCRLGESRANPYCAVGCVRRPHQDCEHDECRIQPYRYGRSEAARHQPGLHARLPDGDHR